jgi:hypothetical protein
MTPPTPAAGMPTAVAPPYVHGTDSTTTSTPARSKQKLVLGAVGGVAAIAAVGLIATALVGGGGGGASQLPLVAPVASQPEERWVADFDGSIADVMVAGDAIYVVNYDGGDSAVVRLAASTGEEQWRTELDGVRSLRVDGGRIWVAMREDDGDTTLVPLSASDGSEQEGVIELRDEYEWARGGAALLVASSGRGPTYAVLDGDRLGQRARGYTLARTLNRITLVDDDEVTTYDVRTLEPIGESVRLDDELRAHAFADGLVIASDGEDELLAIGSDSKERWSVRLDIDYVSMATPAGPGRFIAEGDDGWALVRSTGSDAAEIVEEDDTNLLDVVEQDGSWYVILGDRRGDLTIEKVTDEGLEPAGTIDWNYLDDGYSAIRVDGGLYLEEWRSGESRIHHIVIPSGEERWTFDIDTGDGSGLYTAPGAILTAVADGNDSELTLYR